MLRTLARSRLRYRALLGVGATAAALAGGLLTAGPASAAPSSQTPLTTTAGGPLQGGDPATLYDLARYQIRPLLSRVPGVGRVDEDRGAGQQRRGRLVERAGEAERDARVGRRRPYGLDGGEQFGRVGVERHAERIREIGGPDDERVEPRHGRDLAHARDAGGALDLDPDRGPRRPSCIVASTTKAFR